MDPDLDPRVVLAVRQIWDEMFEVVPMLPVVVGFFTCAVDVLDGEEYVLEVVVEPGDGASR